MARIASRKKKAPVPEGSSRISKQLKRLSEELAARNHELAQASQQLTAASEILSTIASSLTDIQPVLDAVVASAVKLSGAKQGHLRLYDGEFLRVAAHCNETAEEIERLVARPMRPSSRGTSGRAFVERTTIHVIDAQAEFGSDSLAAQGSARTLLAVPLLREGVAIGTISIWRDFVQPFSDRQIQLVTTFADQAVIAIENVRLFNELQERNRQLTESLEQQTATSDVLRAIASSPMELQPVLDTVIANAVRLAGAKRGHIRQYDGEMLHVVAHYNESAEAIARFKARPLSVSNERARAFLEKAPVQVLDAQSEKGRHSAAFELGMRTLLFVPLLREGVPIGGIAIWRDVLEPFTERQIELVKTFADQAVIAIENVRLFKELQERNRDLTVALEQQAATSEVLDIIAHSPVELQPVYQAILSNTTRLCEANIAALFLYDGKVLSTAASHGTTQEFAAHLEQSRPQPSRETTTRLAALERRTIHVADLLSNPDFSPKPRDLYEKENVRAVISVPMLREGRLIGVITTWRREVRPFSDKQVALVKTFADQAVIAIENARLFREIKEKNRQVEAANRHKSEFLANMSHELRTPLNAIIGFSEVLLDPTLKVTDEERSQFLTDVLSSGKHLLGLINEILDLAKIEAGKVDLQIEPALLQDVVETVCNTMRSLAAKKLIGLAVEIDQRLAAFPMDHARIKQVLLNLIGNAIKFTPEGGQVWVRAGSENGSVRVEVGDTGPGIAPEDHERIFEEFQQAGSDAGKPQGTGLGLALAKKFVGMHGGRIWLESEVGQGSKFIFTLPVHH